MNLAHVTSRAAYAVAAAALLLLIACASMQPAPDYAALVAAPDRSDADRKTDERRRPAQILAFTGVRPGMKVLDLGAGGGYSTELLARAVGTSGTVYAQNAPDLPARALAALGERAKRPAMQRVLPVVRPFADPVPPGAGSLDLVTFFFEYHELPPDRDARIAMNRAVFNALKPGGTYVVADHSARAGTGIGVGKTLHRIEESLVRADVEAAGFRFAGSGDFSRNPADTRDVTVFKSPVPVDEFFLKFEKPRQ